MASPQIENGYTRLSNEILEHLSHPGINGSEFRILLVVIRKTYGFRKKQDRISISQFEKFTCMNRAQAVRTIKSLVEKKILLKKDGNYVFNKNYEEWVVHKRGSTQKDTTASIQKDTKSSIQKDTHKRKKETITKETTASRGDADMIVALIDSFKDVNPSYKNFFKNKSQRAALSRLIEVHGFDVVQRVIQVLPKTNLIKFMPNITTPYQLEMKWAQFENQMKRKQEELKESKSNIAFI